MKLTSKFISSELQHGTPEWHQARRNSIGASEIGAIMGLSPYTPAAKIFYIKLGLLPEEEIQNSAVYWGHALEGLIAQSWACHTGEENSYLKGEKKRDIIPVQGYYTTEEHKFITATPDLMSTGFTLNYNEGSIERVPTDKLFPVEIKSISGYSLNQWEAGVPVYYMAQIHAQMMCTNSDYAELAMLKDGRELLIYPIYRNPELCELIIAKCTEFWDRISKARELMKDGVTEEVMSKIASLEPEPEGTPAYGAFLKLKFKVEDKRRIATPEEENLMMSYLQAHSLETQAATSKLDARNKLLRSAEDYSVLNGQNAIMTNRPSGEESKKSYFSIKLIKK